MSYSEQYLQEAAEIIRRLDTAAIERVAARLARIRDEDGRTERPLIADQPLPIAQYELRFGVGDYFVRQGTPAADPPFLGIVPIRFAVAEPEAHYHVPLLVTPWSYSTYRGS